MAPNVEIDFVAFERAARGAMETREPVDAHQALALVRGLLLPDDMYAGWAVVPRQRVLRQQVRLWALIAECATDRGDVESAMVAHDELIELERDDEERYLAPAELLLNQGRPSRALQYIRRAEAAMAELGLDLSAQGRTVRDQAVRAMDDPATDDQTR